jgi:hypothetical protein
VKYPKLYLVYLRSNENEVKYIDLRRKIWNKENDKFDKKWNNIVVVI